MTSNTIIIKKSLELGSIPNLNALEMGELAINCADGYIFFKKNNGEGEYLARFVDLEGQPYVLDTALSAINTQYGGNTVSEVFATVLGGFNNDVSGAASTVINGENNTVIGDFSIIANGLDNIILSGGDFSFIAGGKNNSISHENVYTLGSNLSSHADNFTYVNNISATGKLYGDGSELTGIIAEGISGPDTQVRALTSNWQSTYLTVSALSASWESGGGGGDENVNTLVKANSASWDEAYTLVQANSAIWNPSRRHDFVEEEDYSISYAGLAPSSASESSEIWSITKITYTTSGSISATQYAESVAWIDRLIVEYN
jgi:hypothetical protein